MKKARRDKLVARLKRQLRRLELEVAALHDSSLTTSETHPPTPFRFINPSSGATVAEVDQEDGCGVLRLYDEAGRIRAFVGPMGLFIQDERQNVLSSLAVTADGGILAVMLPESQGGVILSTDREAGHGLIRITGNGPNVILEFPHGE